MYNYIKNGSLVIVCPTAKWTGKVTADCLVYMVLKPNYTRWKLMRMTPWVVGDDWNELHKVTGYAFQYNWPGTVTHGMGKKQLHNLLADIQSHGYVVVTEAGNIFESVNKLVKKV